MQALFKQLVYDKMNFANAKGVLTASEGDLKFNNLGLSAFGGNVVLNGVYSTKNIKKPTVNMDLAPEQCGLHRIIQASGNHQKSGSHI